MISNNFSRKDAYSTVREFNKLEEGEQDKFIRDLVDEYNKVRTALVVLASAFVELR